MGIPVNAGLLALDLIMTGILEYVSENRDEINAMSPEEVEELSTTLRDKRKAWLAKYSK